MSHKKKPMQSPKKRVVPTKPEPITTVDGLIEHIRKTGKTYGLFDSECGWDIWSNGKSYFVALRNRDKISQRKTFSSEKAAVDYLRSKLKF